MRNAGENFRSTPESKAIAMQMVENLRTACDLYADGHDIAAFMMLSEFRSAPLEREVISCIAELLDEKLNKPFRVSDGKWKYNVPSVSVPCDRNLITRALDIFRELYGSDAVRCGVSNLISILKKGRENDLSGEDLSGLDLTNCVLNRVHLSRNGCIAKLDDAEIAHSTIFPMGHSGLVFDMVFTNDGNRLITTSSDKTIKITNAASGIVEATLVGHAKDALSVAVSPDDRYLVSNSPGDAVRVWDMSSHECVGLIPDPEGNLMDASFNAEGTGILAISGGNTVKLWTEHNYPYGTDLICDTASIDSMVVFSDGERIATFSEEERCIKIWNIETTDCVKVIDTGEHTFGFDISPNGKDLVFTESYKVAVLDLENNAKSFLPCNGDDFMEARFCCNGKMMITVGIDIDGGCVIRLWDADTLDLVNRLRFPDAGIEGAVCNNGKYAAVKSADDEIYIVDIENFTYAEKLLNDSSSGIVSVEYNPSGSLLVTASCCEDNAAKVWDAQTGRCVAVLEGHEDALCHAVFTANGEIIATASADHTVRLWNAKSYEMTAILAGHSDGVRFVDRHPFAMQIATASYDDTIRIWDVESNKCMLVIEAPGTINSVRYSPLGDSVVAALSDRICVWSLDTGVLLHTFGVGGYYEYAEFTRDGRYIVSGSDGKVIFWDVNGEVDKTLIVEEEEDFMDNIRASVSPDNRSLLVATWNKITRWDIETGMRIGGEVPFRSDDEVFSPDGSCYAAIIDNDSIAVISTKDDRLIRATNDTPGAFILGCDFRNIHPCSDIKEDLQRLRQLGAIVE